MMQYPFTGTMLSIKADLYQYSVDASSQVERFTQILPPPPPPPPQKKNKINKNK